MTDQFDVCMTDYKAQLATLANPYFPLSDGRPAGWQISEDDTTPYEGGDYFITLRPGSFSHPQSTQEFEMNDWHVTTVLYFKYVEYKDIWSLFRAFRHAVISLPESARLRTHGIYDQSFSASEEAGYLVDSQGNYTSFVVQKLDCLIRQKVRRQRAPYSLGA